MVIRLGYRCLLRDLALRVGRVLEGIVETTLTPRVCDASASMSLLSSVSTMPSGSASATRSASTTEPCPAWVRSSAARLPISSGRSSNSSQVLMKRLVRASFCWRPVKHSASTTVCTRGGQNSLFLSSAKFAGASGCGRANRSIAPESSISRVMCWNLQLPRF